MAISQGEAAMIAARWALEAVQAIATQASSADRAGRRPAVCEADIPAVVRELLLIERRLRRDAVGGDKILLRQMERPTARQVRPSAKDRKRLGGA